MICLISLSSSFNSSYINDCETWYIPFDIFSPKKKKKAKGTPFIIEVELLYDFGGKSENRIGKFLEKLQDQPKITPFRFFWTINHLKSFILSSFQAKGTPRSPSITLFFSKREGRIMDSVWAARFFAFLEILFFFFCQVVTDKIHHSCFYHNRFRREVFIAIFLFYISCYPSLLLIDQRIP